MLSSKMKSSPLNKSGKQVRIMSRTQPPTTEKDKQRLKMIYEKKETKKEIAVNDFAKLD